MLKAGFARLDITLPLGTGLAGYFSPRPAKGVLDPLYLNAVAMSNGEQTVLVITVDALGIRQMFCKEILSMIEKRTGVPCDHIIINALHQHTSFVLRPKGGTCALEDTAYIDLLYRKFCDVSQMAIDDMCDSELYVSCTPATQPISFIRRYRMKDGEVVTNPLNSWKDVVEPAGNADNNVRLLRFKRSGKKDIAIVNFATHPDVVGGEYISADWPGFARKFVELNHTDAHCILVNGFQGDVNHWNCQVGPEERGNGYEYSEKMGRVIADTVNLIWDNGDLHQESDICAKHNIVYNKTRSDGIEDFAIGKEIYEEYLKTQKIPEDAPIKRLPYLRRIYELQSDAVLRSVPVSTIVVGDVAFVGLGGEAFSHYGEAIREAVPEKFILTATCANGFEGYLVTDSCFEEGGYEGTSSPFTPNLEKQCVSAAVDMLKNL